MGGNDPVFHFGDAGCRPCHSLRLMPVPSRSGSHRNSSSTSSWMTWSVLTMVSELGWSDMTAKVDGGAAHRRGTPTMRSDKTISLKPSRDPRRSDDCRQFSQSFGVRCALLRAGNVATIHAFSSRYRTGARDVVGAFHSIRMPVLESAG
jgi:hypothetical protein